MEQPVRLEPDVQAKVPGRSAADTRFTLSREPDYRTVAHTRRNRDVQRLPPVNHSGAAACRTGLAVFYAGPAAIRARFGRMERDAAGGAVVGLFERQLDLRIDVLASHRICGTAPARAGTAAAPKQALEEVAESTLAAQYLGEVVESSAPGLLPSRRRREVGDGAPVRS